MKIVTKPIREAPPTRKKRSNTFLMLQISLGGGVGVLIALLVLKGLGSGLFGNGEAPKVVADNQKPLVEREPVAQTPRPKPTQPKSDSPFSGNRPREKAQPRSKAPLNSKQEDFSEFSPPVEMPPSEDASTRPVAEVRMPIAKEALGEHLAKAKVPQAAHAWWCDRGSYEIDNTGALRFTDFLGKKNLFLPMTSSEGYLEIESDTHQERVRLFLDHAEISREPFEVYEQLYAQGQWVVTSEQTGVDWFPRAIVDLNAALHKSRTTAKEYMGNLFAMADKLKAANKLKDVPFGFDLIIERERFTSRGLVPWSAPLLPMTEEYLQECRKLHKNEDSGYNRVAQRLTTQREKLAKDHLEYHQWRNARAWPIAVLAWSEGAGSKESRYTLYSNGTVNDPDSKNNWKLTKDILDVDIGDRRVRLRVGDTGKDFSLLGQEPPVTGTFVFEGEQLAY